MKVKVIPDIVIGRLPLYLRALQHLLIENRQVTSSQELGEHLGVSAAQIRKDLSQFGEFGKQGTGYQIVTLVKEIRSILKVDREWDLVIVGAGDIGSAIARYKGFQNRGFQVRMIFDIDPSKIGMRIGEFIIQDFRQLEIILKESSIKIAMVAVPINEAQNVADQLIKAGIEAILNYAPISINVPKGVQVQYIDPAVHLQRMTYYLS